MNEVLFKPCASDELKKIIDKIVFKKVDGQNDISQDATQYIDFNEISFNGTIDADVQFNYVDTD